MANREKIIHSQRHELPGGFYAEVYKPSPENWELIREAVMSVEERTFEEGHRFSEALMQDVFSVRRGVAVLLRNPQNEIVGYTAAVPLSWEDERREDVPRADEGKQTAYIESTAIIQEYQNQGLGRIILSALNRRLIQKKYEFIERHAEISNNYATNLMSFHGDGVIGSFETNTEDYGYQLWMRIALKAQTSNQPLRRIPIR